MAEQVESDISEGINTPEETRSNTPQGETIWVYQHPTGILDRCTNVCGAITGILCVLLMLGILAAICYSLDYAISSSPNLDTPYYDNCNRDITHFKPWCVNNCNCVYCDSNCIEWEYRQLCEGEWISKRNSTECQEILEFREEVMNWWSNVLLLVIFTFISVFILYILLMVPLKLRKPERPEPEDP